MKAFINEYFLLSTLEYTGTDFPIGIVLFAVTLGLCAAAFAIYFYKSAMHLLIRRLIRARAFGEESAKTLEQLGLGKHFLIGRMLGGGGKLKRLVCRADEVALTYEEYVRLEKEKKRQKRREKPKETEEPARYYIPESAANAARRVYEEGASSILSPILSSLFLLLFFILVMLLMPHILAFLY